MGYRVIITPPAKRRLDLYIGYTANVLKNRTAAKNIRTDARETKSRLSENADKLKTCENPILAKFGYRMIRFKRHDYIMIYRLEGNVVIVDGMFHELQDYEGIFIEEMKLQ